MRPDEHKKKKNAAYKKKHGIGQAKSEQSGDHGKQKKGDHHKNSLQETQRKKGSNVRQSKGGAAHKEGREQTLSSSSESEPEERRPQRKTFQRRQIVSNWQKYEIEAESEEPQARGESYNQLLSMSGNAVAHFRFKDEEEWDSLGAPVDTRINNNQFDHLLNIDTQTIGQAMGCLPLYQVMGLPQEVFPCDQVEQMEKTAAENRQIYNSDQSEPFLTSILLSSCYGKTVTKETSRHNEEGLSGPASSVAMDKLMQDNSLATLAPINVSSKCSKPSKLAPVISPAVSNSIISNTSVADPDPSQRLTLEDEDLDSLLDLDIPQNASKSGAKASVLGKPCKSLDSPHLQAPARLTNGKNSDRSTTGQDSLVHVSQSQRETADKPQKDGVDLEDWLDSILDD